MFILACTLETLLWFVIALACILHHLDIQTPALEKQLFLENYLESQAGIGIHS